MANDSIKKFTSQNRLAWEEVNALHQQAKQHIKQRFRKEPDFHALDTHLKTRLQDLNIADKSILHLMCNDGEELISAKRMGAGKCMGIDISSTAIQSATELAEELGLEDIHFKQSDAYDVDSQMFDDTKFDIAMTTVGALCWLPDLPLFFRRLNSFLVDHAQVLIHEIHPVSYLLDDNLNLRNDADYFSEKPIRAQGDLDYLGHADYEGAENIEFPFTLSQIIQSLLESGFSLRAFYEYPNDHGNLFNREVDSNPAIPLSFSIIAEKTTAR